MISWIKNIFAKTKPKSEHNPEPPPAPQLPPSTERIYNGPKAITVLVYTQDRTLLSIVPINDLAFEYPRITMMKPSSGLVTMAGTAALIDIIDENDVVIHTDKVTGPEFPMMRGGLVLGNRACVVSGAVDIDSLSLNCPGYWDTHIHIPGLLTRRSED